MGALAANYLEVLVNNEKATKLHLNKICGNDNELFYHT